MHHTVVLSDVHLWDAVAGDGLWMRYRQRRFFPDADLAKLFELLCAEAAPGSLELVFNGDLFDFDVPPVVNGEAVPGEAPRTPELAAARLGQILDDHPVFLAAVARVLRAKHRVVFINGNHDMQLVFPAVRAVLLSRLIEAAAAESPSGRVDREAIASRIVFRAWFHRTEDGVHVEHGNQYDGYCSVRYPMEPLTPDGTRTARTTGSLVVQYLIGRFGYFNPNVDQSFLLDLPGYITHWARYYALSSRSLAANFALNSLRIAGEIAAERDPEDEDRAARNIAACAAETGADPGALAAHAELFIHRSVSDTARILRLDGIALLTLGTAAAALALASGAAAATLALGSVGAFAAFNLAVPGTELETVYGVGAVKAREIARLHDARAVVMGHTHVAYGEWRDGVFTGNCGTWAPQFHDIECTKPLDDGYPIVWLRSDARGELQGGLYRFRRGMLLEANRPREHAAPAPAQPTPALTGAPANDALPLAV